MKDKPQTDFYTAKMSIALSKNTDNLCHLYQIKIMNNSVIYWISIIYKKMMLENVKMKILKMDLGAGFLLPDADFILPIINWNYPILKERHSK